MTTKKLRHHNAPPLGRPRCAVPKENQEKVFQYITDLFSRIETNGENVNWYIAKALGVGYKTVRIWHYRGIP